MGRVTLKDEIKFKSANCSVYRVGKNWFLFVDVPSATMKRILQVVPKRMVKRIGSVLPGFMVRGLRGVVSEQ